MCGSGAEACAARRAARVIGAVVGLTLLELPPPPPEVDGGKCGGVEEIEEAAVRTLMGEAAWDGVE